MESFLFRFHLSINYGSVLYICLMRILMIFILSVVIFHGPLNAQTLMGDSTPTDSGSIIEHIPLELRELDKKYCEHLEKYPKYPGYRIVILSESGANSQNKAKAALFKFEKDFPDIPIYIGWVSPNFQVLAGDFRTKLEAEKALLGIREKYPYAFIKKDKINPPELSGR